LLFTFIYQGLNFLLQNVFNHKIFSSAFTPHKPRNRWLKF
jgi:hypothetical protein